MEIPKEGLDSAAIENLHVNLFVSGFGKQDSCYVVDVPTEKFGRLIKIPRSRYIQETDKEIESIEYGFVFLEDLIVNNLRSNFPKRKNAESVSIQADTQRRNRYSDG